MHTICLPLTHGLMHTHPHTQPHTHPHTRTHTNKIQCYWFSLAPLFSRQLWYFKTCVHNTGSRKGDLVEQGKKERGRQGRRQRQSSWEVFMGSGQEEGPQLKFVSHSMGLEMIAIYPDTMNGRHLGFPFLFSLSYTAGISQTP